MKAVTLLTALAFVLVAEPAAAQFSAARPAPKTWITGWVGGHISPGRVFDPGSNSVWDFGSSFAGGVGVHWQVGSALSIGVDASFAPSPYHRLGGENDLIEKGTARVVTAMATGRLRYGGADAFGMYLTGGVGTMVFGMPSLDRWDPDLALLTGAGLEYRPSRRNTLFVEWGRYWTFHQREGVEDNSSKFSQIRAGMRIGF